MRYLRFNTERAKNAKILIIAVIFVECLLFATNIFQFNILVDLSNNLIVSNSTIEANNFRVSLFSRIYLIVFSISAVFFIKWFRRAYFNLHLISKKLSFSESSAVSSWFIPFLNLVRPYQIMDELFLQTLVCINETEIYKKKYKNTIVYWWVCWVASFVLSNVIAIYFNYFSDFEVLKSLIIILLLCNVLSFFSGFFVIKLINNYSNLETKL